MLLAAFKKILIPQSILVLKYNRLLTPQLSAPQLIQATQTSHKEGIVLTF